MKIGLVGYGGWGRNILRDLRELGVDVEVADIDPTARRRALVAGAVSACEAVGLLSELDGYIVASNTTTHSEVAEALLPRQRPIFIEKPLSSDVPSARRLVEMGAGRIFVMDKWRYHPAIQALAQLVRSGALGKVLAMRTLRLGKGDPHRDVDSCWILLPHDLSIALEIMGELPSAEAAFCCVPGRGASDVIAILQDGSDGFRLTSEISISHPVNSRIVVVIGTSGCARFDAAEPTRIHCLDGVPGRWGAGTSIDVGAEMPLMEELKAFVVHVAGGPPPRAPVRDGLLVVERIAQLRRLAGLT